MQINPPPPAVNPAMDPLHVMTSWEFLLSTVIVVFGVIALTFLFFLLRNKEWNPDQLLRVFGISIIVIGALFLVGESGATRRGFRDERENDSGLKMNAIPGPT